MADKHDELLKKLLLKAIKDPILIYPLADEGFATFVFVNKAACDVYEYSQEEFQQLTILDITSSVNGNENKEEAILEQIRKQQGQRFETIHITKSGKEIPVDINATIEDFNDQKMIMALVRDITDKKHYETRLIETISKAKDTSKMLEDVINTIPVRIFWKDADGNYLGCNQLFAQDAGKSSPEELIGLSDYDMGWAEQAELYRSDDRQVMQSKTPKINYEEPQTSPEGKTLWLRTCKIPLTDKNGEVTGILGTYEDITYLKEIL